MKIFYGAKPVFTNKDKSMFSRGKYECKVLLKNLKNDLVVVSQSKDKKFPVWKVEDGFSCMVFPTYDDAMTYCKDRFFNLDGRDL